jgi:hypothetical protein
MRNVRETSPLSSRMLPRVWTCVRAEIGRRNLLGIPHWHVGVKRTCVRVDRGRAAGDECDKDQRHHGADSNCDNRSCAHTLIPDRANGDEEYRCADRHAYIRPPLR